MTKHVIALLCVAALSACASANGGWFSPGPRPAELAGDWVDSSKTTTADSSIWRLTPSGEDRTLRIVTVTNNDGITAGRSEKKYGNWYLSGALADTAGRALCVRRRPRDGGSCMRFHLDTIERNGRSRRRLVLLGYRGNSSMTNRVLIERLP